MKKENIGTIIGLLVFIAIIVAICVILEVYYFDSKKSDEEKLTAELYWMGQHFYEEVYYEGLGPTLELRKEALQEYEITGLEFDIDTMEKYLDGVLDSKTILFANKKTNELCDKRNSKVIIYPEEPFKKDSYKMKAFLECGFR